MFKERDPSLRVIGEVKNEFIDEVPEDYQEKKSILVIYDKFEKALLGIEEHSHLVILCWFNKSQRDILQVHPMGDSSNPLTGVFATRAPVRPNPIALTVCKLLKREGNTLHVKGLDALNETPVIDIKSYKADDIDDVRYPDWVPRGDRNVE